MAAVTERGRADQLASHTAAELYEQHSRPIFGYCLSRLGRREDAEDATQLTFLHAVRGLRKGVVPAAESAWLFGIARNVCLSRWAATGRRSRVEAACDPTELERVAAARDPHRDELIGLERALERLPEQQRRALLLRDWRGLSYQEVAETLGVSHAAVETLIFRGRAALAEQLETQPAESRRRLRSLGALGSLLHGIKGALTGAAAGAKLAAAVAAVVAVSGTVMAVGVAADDPAPARPSALQPAPDISARVKTDGLSASAPAAAPAVERTPELAAVAVPPAPVATRQVEPPAGLVPAPEAPSLETPAAQSSLLPPLKLPSTGPVSAVTEPVTVLAKTLSSAPPLPSVPSQLPAPTASLPPPPPVSGDGVVRP